MKNRINKIIVAIGVVAILVGGYLFIFANKVKTEKQITIGAILPLTTKAANIGEDIKNGMDLALEDIHNEEGVVKFKISYMDDRCDAKEAVSALYNLKLQDVRSVVGAVCSPSTLAIAPLAEQNKIVLLTPASAAEEISWAGDFVFRNHSTVSRKINILANGAASRFKSVATIFDNSNQAFVLREKIVAEKFETQKKRVLAREGFSPNGNEFRTQILKLKAVNPEVVYVGAIMPQSSIIVDQIRQLGINAAILVDDSSALDGKFLESIGNLSDGIIFAAADFTRENNPRFWDEFSKRFGKAPNVWAAQGYDSFMVIARAIKDKCQDGDSVCVKNELYKTKYQGAGGLISFDSNGDAIKEIVLKKIVDKKAVLLGN